jgi:hypothetical protein
MTDIDDRVRWIGAEHSAAEDPIVHVRFPKMAAGATLDDQPVASRTCDSAALYYAMHCKLEKYARETQLPRPLAAEHGN